MDLMQQSLEFSSDAPEHTVIAPPPAMEPARVAGRTTFDQVPEVSKRRKSLQWEIVAAGLMIAAALALLWWQYHGASGEEEAVAGQAARSRVASLGLTVSPGEGGWRITWDPASSAARDSVRGVLNINEEVSHERIPLNASQIRAGSATYRPAGDDITFRLDLIARDNSLATETYRVLIKPREAVAAPVRREPKTAPEPEKTAKKAPKPEAPEEPAYVDSEVLSRVAPEVPEGIRPRITVPLRAARAGHDDDQGRAPTMDSIRRTILATGAGRRRWPQRHACLASRPGKGALP